ncbi:MAG: SapC family protein [Alphaproteobacteria bacterium]|nr:SapC family protein [Alphaproteobacteria bacterium]
MAYESKTDDAAAETPVFEEVTGQAPRFPLFYNAPRPLEARRHAKTTVAENLDVGFARNANMIPLNIVEFTVAARHYPIVFSSASPFLPVIITGLRSGTNVFMEAGAKRWARGCYIPAYVRRYPFILMENSEQKEFILCADEDSDFLSEEGDRRLFDDNAKPSEVTNQALEYCRAYHAQYEATQRFVVELNERDLLVDNSTEINLADDRKIKMQGYKVIDREKFENLPDEVFLEWRNKNWLPIAYAHMTSLSNWPAILQRASDIAAEVQGAT